MSFAGNLEDLAIVDVIQLLHSTRKSGTLCVSCGKGQSQIVFINGFIVSANHYDGSVRIGKILIEMGVISEEILQEALKEQTLAGEQRKPLIGMLIEKHAIEKNIAYKGLECLIEMIIVEMVSWQKGTFTLDVDCIDINDEYRYIPENLQQDLNFDTQMVLLDALRIYDEKRAAGLKPADFSVANEAHATTENRSQPEHVYLESDQILSADILGLESIDEIAMPIPEFFTSLEAFDPSEIHRQKVREILPDFPSSQREELVIFLTELTNIVENQENVDQEHKQTIILYGADELTEHGLMSACKYEGIMVFTASVPSEFENKIVQSLERGLSPILVFDCPAATKEGFTKDDITTLRQKTASLYPQLQTVQIASPVDHIYALQALSSGANAIIPRSIAENRHDTFIPDFIQFLDSFPQFIHGLFRRKTQIKTKQTEMLNDLRRMSSASQISFFLLEQISQFFERSLTFVLQKGELVAERSFGIDTEKASGPSAPLRFKVKITKEGLLDRVIKDGTLFFSAMDDPTIRESIFGEISAPDKSKILLLPLVAVDRTLGLIYADFGQSKVNTIDCEYLQSLAWVAGMALDKLIRNKG
ncbi:DUF4388 domain-containing protein [Geopsychrobacter electrodiphilus]|uniref:DUF4388 domain-containing protein n=1 Tax=Geopsychrobacter electrodiphilus TaxID=225196 RepID=UPI000363A9B3|nr:DUF4388 domain-containing protein [Geopsychrobacter electrodiphilus]